METKYLINIDNGHLELRDEYVDLQVNLKPVPDELVSMLMKGEVTVEEVLLAVGRKEREKGFDLHAYIEERKKLNVRTSDPQTTTTSKTTLRDRSDETVSVNEVLAGRKEATKIIKKKSTENKSVDDALSGVIG